MFTVVPGEVIYIGHLLVEYRVNPEPGLAPPLDVKIAVQDKYTEAESEFKKRFPNIGKAIRKDLLR